MRSRLAPALVLAAACAPSESQTPPEIHEPHAPQVEFETPAIGGLARLLRDGHLFTGARERFRVEAPADLEIWWSASAGVVEEDGHEVDWTLPSVPGKAWLIAEARGADLTEPLRATFAFDVVGSNDVVYAVNPAAQGQVDPNGRTGDCQLALDSSDRPHVTYLNLEHGQLWYATFTGGSWMRYLADGPGFDIGSTIEDHHAIVADSGGTPHLAYRHRSTGHIWYASFSGGTWTRQRVTTNFQSTSSGGARVAIALDPANGNRPMVAWTRYNPQGYYAPCLGRRSGTTWTEDCYSAAMGSDFFMGGLAVESNGTAWMTIGRYAINVVKWSTAMNWHGREQAHTDGSSNLFAPMVFDSMTQPIVMTEDRTLHKVGASWVVTPYHLGTIVHGDIVVTGGLPRIALAHGSTLEFLSLNPERYWLYSNADTMIAGDDISAAVSTSGATHACYTKSNSVYFK